jgi:hypothetical protein
MDPSDARCSQPEPRPPRPRAPRVRAVGAGRGLAFYERGKVRIRYEEQGKGFPLMLIAGGG